MNKSNLQQTSVVLTGLDGSNPLAFLAAIGVINVLSKEHACSMSWLTNEGTWSPRLHVCSTIVDSIAETIGNLLASDLAAPWNLSKKLPFEASTFRNAMIATIQSPESTFRSALDMFAGFGSEVFCDDEVFQDSAFRMVRSGDSAGQGLPDYACKLATKCETNDVQGALFGPWTFAKGLSSFRWDPSENREYALQAINPSKDGSLTPIGVNRLAFEALALYPTMPGAKGLETVGFIKGSRGTEAEFRWPIWEVPLGVDSIRSLLTCSQVYAKSVDARQLHEIGVASIYCSRQIKPNQYYRNFTPSFQLI